MIRLVVLHRSPMRSNVSLRYDELNHTRSTHKSPECHLRDQQTGVVIRTSAAVLATTRLQATDLSVEGKRRGVQFTVGHPVTTSKPSAAHRSATVPDLHRCLRALPSAEGLVCLILRPACLVRAILWFRRE